MTTPAAVLDLARKGRPADALRLGEQLLTRGARDPRLDHLIGVIACQAGQPARGAVLLGRAHEADRANPDIAFNYAKALADAGKIRDAAALAKRFVRDPRMQRLSAEMASRAGDYAGAQAVWSALLDQTPDDLDALNNLATALLALDRASEATAPLEHAHKLDPGNVVVLRNLARAYLLTAREVEALDALRDANALSPDDPEILRDYGEALMRLVRPGDALVVLVEAARLAPHEPATFVSIGLAYTALAEFGRAEEAHRQALVLDPSNGQALLNLGILYEHSNRIEPLRELVEAAVGRGVEGDEIAVLRVLLMRRDSRFDEALALAKTLPEGAIEDAVLAQTVAQLADRTGDAALAFASFERMNRAVAQTPVGRQFDGTEHRRMVEDMARIVTPQWAAQWTATAPSDLPAPAFLVGFPRSGTTLLDTALMGHSRIAVLEEQPVLRPVGDEAGPLENLGQLGDARLDELRLRYFEEAAKYAPGAAGQLILDKMPLNALRGPLIARLFPEAPILFALRHPCDAVLSCFMQNFRVNQAMASFMTLENAARFYDATMTYWMQCRELLPLRVHEVRYEDMVEDREAVLRPLVSFLGLPWEDAVLRHDDTAKARGFIRTPSYAQVTERIYKRAAGRWERYRPQMAPVLEILAPWAVRFGYGDPREG